jgi:hypothetical protein
MIFEYNQNINDLININYHIYKFSLDFGISMTILL